jgi:hypothetical protein
MRLSPISPLAVLAVLLSLLCSTAKAQNLPSVGTFDQEVAKVRAEGISLSMSELARAIPPEPDNAAVEYKHLAQIFPDRSNDVQKAILLSGVHGAQPSPYDLTQLQSIATTNSDLFPIILEAAEKPKCVYSHDWSKGMSPVNFPEFTTMLTAYHWLEVDSLTKAHSGENVAAVDEISEGFDIAKQPMDDFPCLESYIDSLDIQLDTLEALSKIIYISDGDLTVAQEIQKELAAKFSPLDIKPALRSELIFWCTDAATAIRTSKEEIFGEKLKQLMMDYGGETAESMGTTAYIRYNVPLLLNRLNYLYTICDSPIQTTRKYADEINHEVTDHHPNQFLEALLMPTYANLPSVRTLMVAQARVLRVATEILQYNGTNGSFPVGLDQVSGPPAVDPLGDGPISYRQEEGGFVVYSVGEDGSYDAQDESSIPDVTDPTFRWPQPDYLSNRQAGIGN